MRGPKPTHPVNLTAEEVKSFQQLIRVHSTLQAVAVRARIILRAYDHSEQNNQQIAQAVGITDCTVRRWRGRWVATRTLADVPRSGAPRRFFPQVRISSQSATVYTFFPSAGLT
jgi:hypothetical protein